MAIAPEHTKRRQRQRPWEVINDPVDESEVEEAEEADSEDEIEYDEYDESNIPLEELLENVN